MPEPVTIAAIALGGLSMVSGGIVEGLSDKAFCAIVDGLRNRLRGMSLPENHDVARAIRRAQMTALKRLVNDYMAAGQPAWDADASTRPEMFRERALAFCDATLKRCDAKAPDLNLDVNEPLLAAVDGILAPAETDGPASRRANAIGAFAEDAVLAELKEQLGVHLPTGFDAHFRFGSGGRHRFLDLFGAYVAEEIKQNDRFRNILTVGKLAGIEALAFDTAELVHRLDQRFGRALETIEHTTADTNAKVTEILDIVSRDQGVPAATLRAIAREMDVAATDADADELTALLTAKAREYQALRDKFARLTSDDPAVTDRRNAAAAALAEGRFAEADAELAAAETRERAAFDELESMARTKRLSAAESRAERAAIAMLRGNPVAYRDAAAHYAEAAAIARPADTDVADAYERERNAANSLEHAARIKALAVLRRRKVRHR